MLTICIGRLTVQLHLVICTWSHRVSLYLCSMLFGLWHCSVMAVTVALHCVEVSLQKCHSLLTSFAGVRYSFNFLTSP